MQRALADAAAVLASVAQIVKRAAVLNIEADAARQAVHHPRSSPSRPWPTQTQHAAEAGQGPSRPWPTQTFNSQKNACAVQGSSISKEASALDTDTPASAAPPSLHPPDPASRSFDLPPLAPDGTPTEMKVIHKGATRPGQPDSQVQKGVMDMDEGQRAEALRKLDESLGAYFGHEMEAQQNLASTEEAAHSASDAFDTDRTIQLDKRADKLFVGQEASSVEEGTRSDMHCQTNFTDASMTLSSPSRKITQAVSEQQHTHTEAVTLPNRPPVKPNLQASVAAPSFTRAESPKNEAENLPEEYDAASEPRSVPLRAAKVPSSRIGRLFHYGSLGAGLAWGTAGQYLSGSQEGRQRGAFMSDANVARLVDKLSTMRGAALKLGQFMSIQDSNMLPEQIEQVMLRVQNSANYMPAWQMERVMREDLGTDWRSHFSEFADIPFAAASIGQVHSATLSPASSHALAGKRVAVKVQFPGVAESISSDLANLRWLVTASALLPKGLFLDNTIRVMRGELADECDYVREADMCRKFGAVLKGSTVFAVPQTVDALCSERVLTTEMMRGRPLTQAARLDQEKRNEIARSILSLSLHELFSWRLMQTDPNWTNFLYNERTRKIELIDFGATREYGKEFMDGWLSLLRSAVAGDREECRMWSQRVGYLTGEESEAMIAAHVDSMLALGEPFRADAPEPYPFAKQTITDRVRAQIPLMLRERLTPPPPETYSLNRKLSGAFLLCARLKAEVSCRTMLEDITRDYKMGVQPAPSATSGTIAASALGLSGQRRSFHLSHVARGRVSPGTVSSPVHPPYRPLSQNLSKRWPRHDTISQAMRAGDASTQSNLTLSAPPASPSLAYTPGDPANAAGTAWVPDIVATSSESSKSTADPPAPDVLIRGIRVPGKPNPPGSEDCCMSGCAHCVYDLYAEDLQYYLEAIGSAREALIALNPQVTATEWDESRLGKFPRPSGMDQAKSDSKQMQKEARSRADDEVDRAIMDLDPSMRAFLQLQRKLRNK